MNKRHINADDFESKVRVEKPFAASEVDTQILSDKGYYRVANFAGDPMNEGRTSYFHNSLGGYHAAKPRRYNELFDYQIARNNFEVLNMLNVKYIIFADQQGNEQVQRNEEANGNAWFVENIEYVNSADEEIKALDSLRSKETAIVHADFKDQLKSATFAKDTLATVALTKYSANALEYKVSTSH